MKQGISELHINLFWLSNIKVKCRANSFRKGKPKLSVVSVPPPYEEILK